MGDACSIGKNAWVGVSKPAKLGGKRVLFSYLDGFFPRSSPNIQGKHMGGLSECKGWQKTYVKPHTLAYLGVPSRVWHAASKALTVRPTTKGTNRLRQKDGSLGTTWEVGWNQ